MHCWYAQNQAPTKISFQVSQDGQIWQEIVPPTVLAWEYADTTLENQTFSFEQVQEVRFLRMKVHDANLKWKHFAISELEVYNRQS